MFSVRGSSAAGLISAIALGWAGLSAPAASAGEVVVERGDTLLEIASRSVPSGTTLEAYAQEIMDLNPHAFIGNDPDRMMRGARLTIPEKQIVVENGDSLMKIAIRSKPEGSSLEAHAQAIIDQNPHAFIRNDPDRLMRGAVLTIPGGGASATWFPSERHARVTIIRGTSVER